MAVAPDGGREVVEGILAHPGIDAVSFVGSAPVAKIIYEGAAKTGKRVQALGGAKNQMVVMPDAVVDQTVSGIIGSAFGAAGQRCMAGSVVVTVGEAHERLMPGLVEATEKLSVGDGLDESIDVGPVLAVVRADSLDDAIAIVNASRFGNGTSIFTESAAAVRRYRHDVEAGMIGVNIGVAAPVAFFPFSGWKDSFLGDLHAHGPDAVEFYTRKKTVTSRFFSSGQGHGAYFVES